MKASILKQRQSRRQRWVLIYSFRVKTGNKSVARLRARKARKSLTGTRPLQPVLCGHELSGSRSN